MKLIVAVLAALAGSASGVFHEAKKNVRNNMGEHRVVTIGRKHLTEEVNNLLLSHDADHFGSHHEEGSHFKITPEAKRALESMGVELEDSTEKWLSHFEENYNTEGFICTEGTDACAKRDLQAFYSSYQTLAAIHARMDTIAASSSVATVGSIGTSFQGRDLKVMNIGDQSKPLVFYFCNIHAREWLTPMYCTYMAETLAAGHPLLNNFSFTILPSANPDGYAYSVTTNNQWRKTRKPATTGSTCIGTDPNRNYPINHCGTGSSTNACSETYCGAAPFDQPETAAIRNFGLANANRMIAMNDVHAYSQLWMSPYAWTNTLPPAVDFNKQQSCNKAAVDAIRATTNAVFTYGPIYSTIYPASGGAVDYFYDVINVVYAYTAELRGTSFQPATSNIMPSNLEIFAAMSASLQCIAGLEGIGGGAAPSAPPVLPTPAPVPAPTPGCADLVPSGIVYSGSGAPAPCSELRSYCSAYDFVRQRCPVTCGTCAQAANFKGTSSDIKTVNKVTYTYVAVGFAAFLVAGVAAVVVMRKRVQKTGPAETAIVSDANVSENKVEAAKVEKVVATSGKDAPKDMYDV